MKTILIILSLMGSLARADFASDLKENNSLLEESLRLQRMQQYQQEEARMHEQAERVRQYHRDQLNTLGNPELALPIYPAY